MFVATDMGTGRRDVTIMLKKVEMAPSHLLKIIDLAKCLANSAWILSASLCLYLPTADHGVFSSWPTIDRNFPWRLQTEPD
jgi:hypothetical protein